MGDLKPEEEVAFYYLKDIVGNMKQELLERFLHFITGRPSASLGAITVAINHAGMVEASSSGVNKAQLEGTHNNRVIVPVYDWVSFLGQCFNKMPNIEKYNTSASQMTNLEWFITKRTNFLLNNLSCC